MTMRSLFSNPSHYVETFKVFLKKSTEHQCMQDFIDKKLPQLISSISNGKPEINVLSVGGGSGEIDLEILARLQSEYPGVIIHTDVIEPNAEQINSYKGMLNAAASAEHHVIDRFAFWCSRVRYRNNTLLKRFSETSIYHISTEREEEIQPEVSQHDGKPEGANPCLCNSKHNVVLMLLK